MKKSEATRTKLLRSATRSFAAKDFSHVSIAEIARDAEMTPQGVYRYFKGKDEIYLEALKFELDSLHSDVMEKLIDHPLPALTGAIWHVLAESAKEYLMARKIIPLRDPKILEYISTLPSRKQLHAFVKDELYFGQKHGLIRQDIHIDKLLGATYYFSTNLLYPLLFEDKYLSESWMAASQIMVGYLFHPVPDLSTPEKIKEYESKVHALGTIIKSQHPENIDSSADSNIV